MGKKIVPIELALLVVVLVWFLPWHTSLAEDDDSTACRRCHSGEKARSLGLKDIFASIKEFQYRHPVVEKSCTQCHTIKEFRPGNVWELFSSGRYKELVFPLKNLSDDRQYHIELTLKDAAGREVSMPSFKFVPLELDNTLQDDQTPPLIRNVRVKEIKRAIFLEATISWETDEPTNSVVEYGWRPGHRDRTVPEDVYVKEHRVTVTGLKPNKLYRFRITSRDIFGNTAVSEELTLDTSEHFNHADPPRIIDRDPPAVKEVRVVRIKGNDDVYLHILSNKAVRAFVRINEPTEMDRHEFGLLPARVSQIVVCKKCHPQGQSHPVGVRSAGPRTRIPTTLPTIEGGMITCVTCHYPHGGNKRYFARLDIQRDLCVACHRD